MEVDNKVFWYNNTGRSMLRINTGDVDNMGKFTIQTMGCQMNQHDSEIMRALLEEAGYTWTDLLQEADLVVLNTCSVREHAERRALGFLGNLKSLKTNKPEMIIAVGGCMSHNPDVVDYIRKKFRHVDIVFGTRNFDQLPAMIRDVEERRQTLIEPDEGDERLPGLLPAHRSNRFQAYVTIMYGCNNFCSYCIVPYTRGREKSRPTSEVMAEISALAASGYQEVTLLGQNVNSYGKDLPGEVNFASLLEQVELVPGLPRVRYMTSHPRDFSDQLIKTIAGSHKVCPHFHLPIQSGSNQILKQMNRGYTREDYLLLTTKIRAAVPDCSLTTDLIIGFPGESEQDFRDTLDLVERVRYDAAYTFLYSRRRVTPASRMTGQVDESVKKDRLAALAKVQNQISLEINQALAGKTLDVLVEGPSKSDRSLLSGRTATNKIVIFPGELPLEGQLVPVEIARAQTWTLFGKIKK
jgi:tRNA-2-methylthio-N6-dimethylallyladenosine synthase